MTAQPWDFGTAVQNCQNASRLQAAAEDQLGASFRDFALAEENYRKALASKIVEIHAEGVAWSSTADLARGDKDVARLRRERDIAEGVVEAMKQVAWRRAADRKDAQRFADWSQKRELAEVVG